MKTPKEDKTVMKVTAWLRKRQGWTMIPRIAKIWRVLEVSKGGGGGEGGRTRAPLLIVR